MNESKSTAYKGSSLKKGQKTFKKGWVIASGMLKFLSITNKCLQLIIKIKDLL